jgi:hypothetical protein
MLKIEGRYRIQSIYQGENAFYVNLKDKSDGSLVKMSFPLTDKKSLVDDGLIDLKGEVKTGLYQNNVTLAYEGTVNSVPEK